MSARNHANAPSPRSARSGSAPESSPLRTKKHFCRKLGPGLITGASDDDPSGIATYSQTGAQFGYGMTWLMLFSYPLMIVIQEICARIGRVTGVGIAGNMRRHYPRPLLFAIVSLLCLANVFNLGADLGAMGAAGQLLLGGSLLPYVVGFAALSLVLQIYIPYTTYVKYLKWLTLALFAYVLTAFVAHVDWRQAAALDVSALDFVQHKIFHHSHGCPRHDDQPVSVFLAGFRRSRGRPQQPQGTCAETRTVASATSNSREFASIHMSGWDFRTPSRSSSF